MVKVKVTFRATKPVLSRGYELAWFMLLDNIYIILYEYAFIKLSDLVGVVCCAVLILFVVRSSGRIKRDRVRSVCYSHRVLILN